MTSSEGLEVGIDVADERVFDPLLLKRPVLRRMFTDRELDECLTRHDDAAAALARRFAAKEAVIKACGRVEGHFSRIEVLHDDEGRPIVNWDYLTDRNLTCRISLSSSKPFAVAIAVVFRA